MTNLSVVMAAALAVAVSLAGCTADDEPLIPQDGAPSQGTPIGDIVISGGGPGDLVAGTRAYVGPDDKASGPQVQGVCRADRLEVYPFFVTSGYTIDWPDADSYNYVNDAGQTPNVSVQNPIEMKIMGLNAYANAQASIVKNGDYIYLYNTALAYTDADRALFRTDIGNRETSTLTLEGSGVDYSTPELYYGILHVYGDDWHYDGDEAYWYGMFNNSRTADFQGRIFRIVSQINLTMTDIPVEAVDRVELYGDHYPTQVRLNGTHGTYYPVDAVVDTKLTTDTMAVLLASEAISAEDSTVTLSSFFLPSELGMRLRLKVTYKPTSGTDTQADADKATPGDIPMGANDQLYDIRPMTSQYLTGGNADIYNVGEALHHGDGLFVYDGNAGNYCFYSYSNVRVNMSGTFSNIAAETGESDITIWVDPDFQRDNSVGGLDPDFDGTHDFDIIE